MKKLFLLPAAVFMVITGCGSDFTPAQLSSEKAIPVTVSVSPLLSGSIDTTFSTVGKVTTSIGSSYDVAYALGIQSDGRIVAAGYSENGSNYDFVLVRYLP